MKKMKMINMNISMINHQSVQEEAEMTMNQLTTTMLVNVSAQLVIKHLLTKIHYINIKFYT